MDLYRFYEHNQDFIVPKFYLNKVKSFLNNKLMDVSISRNDSTWGIPITSNYSINQIQKTLFTSGSMH